MAVTGADLGATLDGRRSPLDTQPSCAAAGSVLRFGERRRGARAYVAFDGGIDDPPVLGSRATHAVGELGGIGGRPLQAGDRLPLGSPEPGVATRRKPRAAGPAARPAAPGCACCRDRRTSSSPPTPSRRCSARASRLAESDRMGYRLRGPRARRARRRSRR